ncbi:MAG: hypothetical protein GF311_07975 [Candidatus Lokiarchaeota archaeon]|nr:hypothetical protein [Candidatus Lokiarchaeota archaeon]
MSLDKWIKSDEKKEEKEEKPEKKRLETEVIKKPKDEKSKKQEEPPKLKKFVLICSNSKCNYQKTLMKRELSDRDKICPRCKKEMKVKEA